MRPEQLRRMPFQMASALTLVFPFLVWLPVAADIALCVIGALFLLRSWQEKDWAWLKETWARLLGALWLYMIARGLFAPHLKDAMARSLPFGRYLIFTAALARWTLADDANRRRFFIALAVFLLLCSLDGLMEYLVGFSLRLQKAEHGTGAPLLDFLSGVIPGFHPLEHDQHGGHVRLYGPFSKPILGIILTWLAFPALLPHAFAGASHRRSMALAAVGFVLTLSVIFFSGERMALLLTLMGLGLCALLLRLPLRLWLAGLVTLSLLLGALIWLNPAVKERQLASTGQTLTHWRESPYGQLLTTDLALAAIHPLFGLGANQYRQSCEDMPGATCDTHPHNIWLEWLIEEGVAGLLLFAGFVFVILKDGFSLYLARAMNPACAGLLIAFILRVWPFMPATDFSSRWGSPPFWLVLGALLVYIGAKGGKDARSSLSLEKPGF